MSKLTELISTDEFLINNEKELNELRKNRED